MFLPILPWLLAVTASSLPLQDPQDPQAPQEPAAGDIQIPEGAVQEEGDWITLAFDETPEGLSLRQFIAMAQKITGLTFTVDTSSGQGGARPGTADLDQQKILLYGRKRMRKSDFYSFFQIMMKINGYVCVTQGSGDLAVIVITPTPEKNPTAGQAIKANTLFVDAEDVEQFKSQPGVYITTVVRLKYANAQTLGTGLRNAVTGPGTAQEAFMPLAGGSENAILIQGFGPFVAWATRLVRSLDVKPEGPEPVLEKIPLQEASAEEVAQLLQDLLEDTGSPETRAAQRARQAEGGAAIPGYDIETRVIAFPRDNSLLVVASPDNLERVKDLIAKLDTRLEVPETNFRVYQLQNISAKDLAEDLKDFLERTQQAEEQAARAQGQTGGTTTARTEQRIVLQDQEETNSLLITATRTKWAELERLLNELDKVQPQVLIETALIEVTEDFARDFGVEFASVNPPDGDFSTGFGFTSTGLSTLIDTDGDNLADTRVPDQSRTGLVAGILDGEDFGIPLLVAAAQTTSNTNILSIPSILVTNNRAATVESKDEIPTATQTPTQGVGVTTTFNDYQEAGIKLSITPSISSRKYLRLAVSLEISAFRGTFVAGSVVPPPRITRSLTTTVYLPDGATMWIGGIIRDDLSQDETGIPWLSDVPVLGWVFGRHEKSTLKTTLYFFCTPRILERFDELVDISERAKARAAEVISLERVRQVDPGFQFQSPLDVILDEDVNGDGQEETGLLDLSSFSAPAFVAPTGFIAPDLVGADAMSFYRDGALLLDTDRNGVVDTRVPTTQPAAGARNPPQQGNQ
ncbi:MAG: hypothetical protein EYC70_03890 [Planctomycetota bacterium]|nr:MAG: hypothetical protein EYC70_03890 [Planctomycetota bacterium]